MRHGKKTNHLGRKRGHRRALLSNLASALITNKRILTTVAKAKELRRYIEPLITKSKDNSTHSRRVVFSYLQDKVAAKELFDVIAVKVADRPGGYVRIIRYENRPGDNAEMAFIELVDFNEVYTADGKKTQTPKAKRTRRGGAAVAKPKTEEKEEVQDEAEIAETEIDEESVAEPEVVEPIAEVEQAPVAEVEEEAPVAETEEAESIAVETPEDQPESTDENTEEEAPKA
jgi:large subunit ribosomal protein L17